MDISVSLWAFAKLAGIFCVLIVLLRLRCPLWIAILAAAVVIVPLCSLPFSSLPAIAFDAVSATSFLVLALMIFLILLLSGVQEATGQSGRLVEAVERRLRLPRLRLVIFPALIGLLPMPGGALFSCPMIKEAAREMDLGENRKILINYWFRHIWEVAWPLYPGYVLTCSLLHIPVTRLWLYTFPIVPLSFFIGWRAYMRFLAKKVQETPEGEPPLPAEAPAGSGLAIFRETLPIVVTLAGAALFTLLMDRFFPDWPPQLAFSIALCFAIATALFQGWGKFRKPLGQVVFSPNMVRMLLLVAAIFIFKEVITAGGLLADLSRLGVGPVPVVAAFILLPLIGGLLTGIMVGFVGLTFPLLLALLENSPLKEYTLPLVILGLVSGNCGQMLSPLHICLAVTCEYFKTPVTAIWRSLPGPSLAQAAVGTAWVAILAYAGAHL